MTGYKVGGQRVLVGREPRHCSSSSWWQGCSSPGLASPGLAADSRAPLTYYHLGPTRIKQPLCTFSVFEGLQTPPAPLWQVLQLLSRVASTHDSHWSCDIITWQPIILKTERNRSWDLLKICYRATSIHQSLASSCQKGLSADFWQTPGFSDTNCKPCGCIHSLSSINQLDCDSKMPLKF